MKQFYFFSRTQNILIFMFCVGMLSFSVNAQVTEHFSDEVTGASTFTSNGFSFNLAGGRFVIANFPTYGWTGSAKDDYYADNYGNYPGTAGVLGSVTISSGTFKVNDLYVFPGETGDFVANTGSVIIRGKLSGSTQFTHTIASGSINTFGFVDNGYTYANLSAYSSYTLDQLEFEVTGALRYLAIDAFKHTSTASNSAPTNISLSASSISENATANSTVGALSSTDPDAGNTFTYTLVAGTGSTDNASFNISGSSLRITGSPDFETKSSYSVRVRSTDQGSLYTEKAFAITISNVNEAPTDVSLSANSIDENVAANSIIGTLGTTDPDVGNTFTYTLVAGTGSADNASFNISGSSLRINGSPDFEIKNSYSVRIRSTDQGSIYTEKAFAITINDIPENVAAVVTTQAVTDISGTGATGNGNITSLGVPNPIQYGVVWSMSTNPTIALPTKTEHGAIAVTGVFTSSITGLSDNTLYYVKAYATNSAGTSYGDEVTFTTLLTDVATVAFTAVKIYPNPAKESVSVSTGNSTDNGLFTILSPSGMALANGVIANGEAKITLEKFKKGIYFLQIQVGNTKGIYKIVKR